MEQEIPKIIHLVCKDKAAPLHYLNRIRTLQPGWDIRLYDDADIIAIVKKDFPHFLEALLAFPTWIQRLDVFRMLIIYQYGGFYMDTDVDLLKPLDALLRHEVVLAEEKILQENEMKLKHHKYSLRIANYMFGSIPLHPFLDAFAKSTLSKAFTPVIFENDILETTGPGALTNFYHEHANLYPEILLLKNPGFRCTKNCSPQTSCRFGDYAIHYHHGSWRWQKRIGLVAFR